MKTLSRIICFLSPLFLLSCGGSLSYYKPNEITPEAFLMFDSVNTIVVFNVPAETLHFPAGAIVEDKGDVLKVFLVKGSDQMKNASMDVKVELVKNDSVLSTKGYKPNSYFLSLPTKGRGYRFCNQGGCGDLNTRAQTTILSSENQN